MFWTIALYLNAQNLMTVEVVPINDIKVHVFSEKNIEKKHLCYHEKNYCYFFRIKFSYN